MKLFVKVLDIPKVNLMSMILVVSVVGAFAVGMNYADIIIMFGAGFLGYIMKRFDFPVVPLILGLVLGSIIETNFRRSLMFSSGNLAIFYTNPFVIIFLLLSLAMILGPAIRNQRASKKAKNGK
jgi:putative tricarboxylic transport membrane protein